MPCSFSCSIALTSLTVALVLGCGRWLAQMPPPPVIPNHFLQDGGRFVLTNDGRYVEYFVYGSTLANATVLLEIAGGLCSAKLYSEWKGLGELANKLNVKCIAVTLPRWGHSSLSPGRKYVDYPKNDIEPILKAEGVDGGFYVSGASLGAPHAMSVAQHYKDRVLGMGLRVPFVDSRLSEELGLPKGQPSIPSKSLLDSEMWHAWVLHLVFRITLPFTTWPFLLKRLAVPPKLDEDHPDLVDIALRNII